MDIIKLKLNNFLYKYLYILKAISNGYIVRYIGGNKFEFRKKKQCSFLQSRLLIL
jgi:hypothetical protein